MNTPARTPSERIEDRMLLDSGHSEDAGTATLVQHIPSDLAMLRSILEERHTGAAFQSVVMATVKIVERVACHEYHVAEAALSLGQREKLDEMLHTIDEMAELLRAQLDMQGNGLTRLCGEKPAAAGDAPPWPEALFEAVEALSESVNQLTSLSNAQQKESPARALSNRVADLLRAHHNTLLVEAEQWTA
ncbi:MAG: hypothetical protein PPP56_03665 [Longimonas sp.]|uniref:hypothetical protein n=1 Tax=Longimonas sp. TaxID=2039626 RepID=UPI00335704BE